jgi:hypothetical protein
MASTLITLSPESFVRYCDEHEGTILFEIHSPEGPRITTRKLRNLVYDLYVYEDNDFPKDETLDILYGPSPTPYGALLGIELVEDVEGFYAGFVDGLHRHGLTGELRIMAAPGLPGPARVNPHAASITEIRATAIPIPGTEDLPMNVLLELAELTAELPIDDGETGYYSAGDAGLPCDRSEMVDLFQISLEEGWMYAEIDAASLQDWPTASRVRNVATERRGQLGFSDLSTRQDPEHPLLLVDQLTAILAKTPPDTFAAIYVEKNPFTVTQSGRPWPHLYQESAEMPYPVQLVRADRAERLEQSPNWEHTDLDDGRTLIRPRQPEQWFGPGLPTDDTTQQARLHLAPLAN